MSTPGGWDVVVIGLGPAGAHAAAAAARAGARVIAFDRRHRPGEPVQCAELVPRGLQLELGPLHPFGRQPIRRLATAIETGPLEEALGFHGLMIDRAAFDRAAVGAAMRAGAECRFGIACRGLDAAGTLSFSDGSGLACKAVIAADGPRSTVGRAARLVNAALLETRQITVPLARASDAIAVYLTRRLAAGYGWLFPAGDGAHLGVGARRGKMPALKTELEGLRRRLLEARRIGGAVLSTTGGAIPCGGIVGPVGRIGRVAVLLAGDAAGLANPVSGAGIAAAVMSGRLAGIAAAALASGCAAAADDYADEIEDLFGASLRRALAQLAFRSAGCGRLEEWRRSWIGFPQYWN